MLEILAPLFLLCLGVSATGLGFVWLANALTRQHLRYIYRDTEIMDRHRDRLEQRKKGSR